MNGLIRLRIQNKLSQQELANKAKVTRVTLARIEEDKTDPRLSTLKKIANALNVHVCYLLLEENEVIDYKTVYYNTQHSETF